MVDERRGDGVRPASALGEELLRRPPCQGRGHRGLSSVYEQISAKDNKIIELQEENVILKRQVWDLEEGLKEKDEVISARTAAVGLASASLAAKGKDTLDQLEDTRAELRRVQGSWSGEQLEWKREREEVRLASFLWFPM